MDLRARLRFVDEWMKRMKHKAYLGDSVYVEIEDGMVKLTTNNGHPDDPRNVICLEEQTVRALMDWFVRILESVNEQDSMD